MTSILQVILFVVTVAFMLFGLVGIILPIVPGILLIWLSALAFAIIEDFQALDWPSFSLFTLLALLIGTADFWMVYLGAKKGGAAKRSVILGFFGAIVGFFLLGPIIPIAGSVFGGVAGYAIGVLLGQYHKHQDWNVAVRAAAGGLAGWGIATVVQLLGGILLVIFFIWQVLAY